MYAQIIALASHLPERIVNNESIRRDNPAALPDKLSAKTGIESRHVVAPGETALDLAEAACRKLFQRGVLAPSAVDALVFCTQSPDFPLPPNSCLLQRRLELPKNILAFDFSHGCSGFVYGLALAKTLIEGSLAKNVILVTADTYSKYLAPRDYAVRSVFGDAAAAVFLRNSVADRPFLDHFVFETDGSGAPHLIVPNGGAKARNCDHEAGLKEKVMGDGLRGLENLYMNGPEIFAFALDAAPRIFKAVLEKASKKSEEVDLFVFHQANRFMLDHLRRKLDLPEDRFYLRLRDIGNVVSSSIPLALERALAESRIGPGALVMLLGFGVGFSSAGCLITL